MSRSPLNSLAACLALTTWTLISSAAANAGEAVTTVRDSARSAIEVTIARRTHYETLLATLTHPDFTPEWKARALDVFLATDCFLRRLQAHGFAFKQVVKLGPTSGSPTWYNGHLSVYQGKCNIRDLGYLAHEMGHGFHENLREGQFLDVHGEEWAEAIRYFVEQRMGTGRPSGGAVLDACAHDEDQFIEMLKDGRLLKACGVK